MNISEAVVAIDTNIIVRLLTADDEAQTARALAVLESGSVWVSLTVLLEASWVLRSSYGLTRDVIVNRLRAFSELPMVALQDAQAARQAMDWTLSGMDLADALHLAQAKSCETFVTFDKVLVRTAEKVADATPVREP